MVYLVWTLTSILMLAGLVGTLVPLLPGTLLILLAALAHKLLLPASLAWSAVAWIGALWIFSVLADFACTLLGTRIFGGSKWGMAGAGGGALAGMFFSLPALIFGTIFGAIAAEKWMGKRNDGDALRAGVGAGVGFLAATVVRFSCAVVMISLYMFAVVI